MDHPDDNGACEVLLNSMSEAQQVQLRAQIIVVGSILRDRVPIEETLMSLCFADISQGQTLEAFNEDTFRRSLWESTWLANAKFKNKVVAAPTTATAAAAAAPAPPKKAQQPKAAAAPPKAPPAKKPATRPAPKAKTIAPKAEQELENLAVSVLTHDLIEEKTSTSEATHPSEDMSDSDDDHHLSVAARFPEGTAVEVMATEDGLRGVWFAAKVESVKGDQITVVYDDLIEETERDSGDDEDEEKPSKAVKLKEVVQYHAAEDAAPRVRVQHSLTSADIPIKQKPYNLGDHVDKWMNDGWWEGEVQGINSDNKNEVTLFYPAEGDNGRADLSCLRPSLVWKGRKWVPWTREASKRVPKRKSVSTRSLEVKKKKVEAAPPAILDGKRLRQKPKWLKDDLDEAEEEEEEYAAAAEQEEEEQSGRAPKRGRSERLKKKPVRKSKRK